MKIYSWEIYLMLQFIIGTPNNQHRKKLTCIKDSKYGNPPGPIAKIEPPPQSFPKIYAAWIWDSKGGQPITWKY
jgi:hypothetical protein